ncbi:MAG TPA: hypothetical protein VII92_17765 [Anaerolineae bacterium]
MSDGQKFRNALALIEFVRNHAADMCQNIACHHFANKLAWSQKGVDPLCTAQGVDGVAGRIPQMAGARRVRRSAWA